MIKFFLARYFEEGVALYRNYEDKLVFGSYILLMWLNAESFLISIALLFLNMHNIMFSKFSSKFTRLNWIVTEFNNSLCNICK